MTGCRPSRLRLSSLFPRRADFCAGGSCLQSKAGRRFVEEQSLDDPLFFLYHSNFFVLIKALSYLLSVMQNRMQLKFYYQH